jgi:hypothetical protein
VLIERKGSAGLHRLADRLLANRGELLDELGNVLGAESNLAVDFDRGELTLSCHPLDPPGGQSKCEGKTGRGQQVDEHRFRLTQNAHGWLEMKDLYPYGIPAPIGRRGHAAASLVGIGN